MAAREVDNPLFNRAHADAAGNPARITVMVNLRESPLEWLAARKFIGPAQKRAGERFRACYEAATLGGGRAIDYTRPYVQTSGLGDPLTEQAHRAAQELAGVARMLGATGYALMIGVCGEGRSLDSMAIDNSEAARRYVGKRFRECLSDLARLWGYS